MNNQSKNSSVIKVGVIDYYYIFDYTDTKKMIKKINLIKKLSKSELAIGHAIKNDKTREIKVEFKEHFLKNIKKDSDCEFLEKTQQKAMNRFQQTIESEIIYTSNLAYDYKNVYLLYPIKVVLENKRNAYIDIYLDLLDSGICILNASFTIFDIPIRDFSINKWDINVEKAYIPKFKNADKYLLYEEKSNCNSISEIIELYIEMLQKSLFKHNSIYNSFSTLSIGSMTNSPPDFKNIDLKGTDIKKNIAYLKERKKYQELIYTLLNAPILHKYQIPYNVAELNDNRSKNIVDTIRLYATPNRILYVSGKDLYAEIKEEYDDKESLYEKSYLTHRTYANFAVHKMLLKQYTNMKYVFSLNASLKTKKLYKLELVRDYELRYESNDIFFSHASASELVNYFYDKCINKNKEKILEEAIDRTNRLIQLNREKESRNFNYIISIFTLIIATIFSMAGIKEVYNFFDILDKGVIKNTYIMLNLIIIASFFLIFSKNSIETIFYRMEALSIRIYIGIKNIPVGTINLFCKIKHYIKK